MLQNFSDILIKSETERHILLTQFLHLLMLYLTLRIARSAKVTKLSLCKNETKVVILCIILDIGTDTFAHVYMKNRQYIDFSDIISDHIIILSKYKLISSILKSIS